MSASESVCNAVGDFVNSSELLKIINLQECMLNKFEKTNEMLRTVSELSATRYQVLFGELTKHVKNISLLKKELDSIFKRINVIKSLFNAQCPNDMAELSEHFNKIDKLYNDDNHDSIDDNGEKERDKGENFITASDNVLSPKPMQTMCSIGVLINAIRQDFNSARSILFYCLTEAKYLTTIESRALRVVQIGFLLLITLFYLLIQCNLSNSLTLTAFTHLLVFDFLSIIVALISIWTKRKSVSLNTYTLGYERFEVVSVFSTTILAILLSFFEIKEAVERIFEPDEIYPNYMIIPCLIALIIHVIVVYWVDNFAFAHVIQACGSSWLQEHTTDISRSVCRVIPGLSRILLPRVNPISLIGVSTSSTVCLVYFLMTNRSNDPELTFPDPFPDTMGGILISLMLFGTMTPMTLYSGRILLQTIPAHLVGPLDKALREASTVEGVLELQNEHIWSVGYDNLAGSLYVRVRRDANEQMVLAHVTNRLCSLVKYLTVQVYKDDWTRTTNSFALNWSFAGKTIPVMQTRPYTGPVLVPPPYTTVTATL